MTVSPPLGVEHKQCALLLTSKAFERLNPCLCPLGRAGADCAGTNVTDHQAVGLTSTVCLSLAAVARQELSKLQRIATLLCPARLSAKTLATVSSFDLQDILYTDLLSATL